MERIFISYSSADRDRIEGLHNLLDVMGHEGFVDFRTIKPGMRWEKELHEGLENADMLLVFWTHNAAESDWVRKEYSYFQEQCGHCPIIPILADETPLPEELRQYQHTDFNPLINELLELKRRLKKTGISNKEIKSAILKRLSEAGIEVEEKKRRAVFKTFGVFGVGVGAGVVGTLSHSSTAQAALIAVAATAAVVIGILAWNPATYLGCYVDGGGRVLNGHSVINDGSMTNSKCQKLCSQQGFVYAGTEYSHECYCGNTLSASAQKVLDSDCDYKCAGNSQEKCGGYWRISIYRR